MFNKGEPVVLLEEGEFGTVVKDNDDGTVVVNVGGETRTVSEFDLGIYEDDITFEDDDDTLFDDLAPYRNLNQNYL
jgi:hypothetical protein